MDACSVELNFFRGLWVNLWTGCTAFWLCLADLGLAWSLWMCLADLDSTEAGGDTAAPLQVGGVPHEEESARGGVAVLKW